MPRPKVTVVRTEKNYGLALSGKLGTLPDLEEEYVWRFIHVDAKDGITSLREALLAYEKDRKAWDLVLKAQAELEAVKDKLLAAGYSGNDLVKLALDNSEMLVAKEERKPRRK
ncbi:MAG TPA: hypothetical protein VHF22_06490 [Planctomycetota bacterium]|nr:hypothetical protein [Planctomycetota bacterium]